MRKVPTSVLVLAIIGLILGALGLCGMVWSVISIFVPFGPPNPMLDALRNDALYLTFTVITAVVGTGFALLLIAACIGSFMLRPWARKGMIVYAWVNIVQGVIGSAFNFIYVFPKMAAALPPGADPAFVMGLKFGMAAGACGVVLAIIYPACVLFFFSRRHVVDAFNGIFPVEPTNFPVAYPENPAGPNDGPTQFP
jgi:hypothetical protein